MVSPKASAGWQFEELRRFLEANKNDPLLDKKAVRLMNPEDVRFSDTLILDHFWPAILKAIAGTPATIIPSPDSDIPSKIYTTFDPEPSRVLMFALEDPKRPISGPHHAPWFLRGHVECSPLSYMLSYDVFIYFPTTFSLRRIIKLLANPGFSGNPPEMSYWGSWGPAFGPSSLTVKFTGGSGAGWLVHAPEVAVSRAEQMVRTFIDIAAAVYMLEKDFTNLRMLGEVTKRLLALYKTDEA